MIPYIELPVYHLGPLPIDPWGTLVCIGFILGLEMARARGIKTGLDVRDVVDGIVATVGSGFVFGHLVHVLVYNPQLIDEKGWIIVAQLWAGFSSFGGFLGAVIGSLIFFRLVRKRSWMAHADAIMFGFPFGWIFGRLGCFSVHDHVGRLTTFPLAVQFPAPRGTRFDLGLLEALLAMVIAAVFLVLARKPRVAGTFLATWCLLYAPVRFGLDFLRAGPEDVANGILSHVDVRWEGLTPAQWGCMVMFGAGVALTVRLTRAKPAEAVAA